MQTKCSKMNHHPSAVSGPDYDYITKFLTPLTHLLEMYIPKSKHATSKGPIVPKKKSDDSVAIVKRETCEQKLKNIEKQRCMSINELDED